MENIIEVRNLTKSYHGKVAVKDFNLTVSKGEIFGLLGHNGAGKSTTIECILGVKKRDTGEVKVLGMEPASNRRKLFQKVGVQFQQSCYQDKIKVWEICEETACLYRDVQDYEELLERFDLKHVRNQYLSTLSGGEKQKISIILALIPNPEVIFLDELTTGLDTVARRNVWKHLENLKRKGLTILLTSHYMDEVEALCDRICVLKEGNMIAAGTVKELVEKSPCDRLEDAYLWYMGEEMDQ